MDSSTTQKPSSTSSSCEFGTIQHITSLSINEDGTYTYDESAMRIFRPPTPQSAPVDLYNRVQSSLYVHPFKYFRHPKHLDSILDACISTGQKQAILGADVVTWRGILTKIMVGEKVSLHISMINGILFMEEEDPKPNKKYRMDIGGAVGKAFEDMYTEACSFINSVKADQRQWGKVVTRTVGNLALLYYGEVDAVRDDKSEDMTAHPIELKSRTINANSRPPPGKWFIQSYLLGVPEIYVGHRDDKHRIVKTELLQVSDLSVSSTGKADRLHNVLLNLRSVASPILPAQDDTIWNVTIKSGFVSAVRCLSPQQTRMVKQRRDDPANPIERIGIVPRRIIDVLGIAIQKKSFGRI